MDLEQTLQDIQNQINVLNQKLNEAQNQKLTSEVQLKNEEKEFENLKIQLQEMTGLSNMSEIEQYLSARESELNNIMQDLENASYSINSNYTFTENDVNTLKGIINKYNIPIGE